MGEASRGSEHIAAGRTDRESRIDQADMGIGLGKITALGLCGGNEMFGEQSDMIGGRQHTFENHSRGKYAMSRSLMGGQA